MSRAIPAIFDSGMFRPLQPVDWPDGTRAEVIPLPQAASLSPEAAGKPLTWPTGYFDQTAGALSGEDFERPPQGELP